MTAVTPLGVGPACYPNGPAPTSPQAPPQEAQESGPADQGPSPARVANSRLHEVWHGTASGSSYPQLFGQQSYVKDGSDPQLLSLLSEAVSKAPELQGTALGQHVAMGKVGPEDIQILQSFLESKGYSVGGPGVDGKYGPLTHSALERFLDGQPPDPQSARPGASGQPRQTVAA